jgi:hypothetical protein
MPFNSTRTPFDEPKNESQQDEFSAPLKAEITALRRLYRKNPISIEVEQTIEDCIESGAVWRRNRRRNQKRLWNNLGFIYRLWVNLTENEEDQQAVFSACDRQKIRLRADTDLLQALVHLSLRPGGEAAHRYATALREAALQGISPEELPSHFAEKGQGINAMAEAYRARKKAHKCASAVSDNRAKSRNGNDDDGNEADPWDNDESEADNSEGDDVQDEENDAVEDPLNIEWGGPKIRKKWREATVGTVVQVRIKKLAEDRGRLLPRKRQ